MHSMPKSVVKVGCMWWYQRLPYVEFSFYASESAVFGNRDLTGAGGGIGNSGIM